MKQSAQKVIVDRYLDWQRVEDRLQRYPNINSQFPIEHLRSCADNPPYYCHYMAWRLGTWIGDEWFEYFDDLLGNGISLKNWTKKSQLINTDFSEFWGLLWELQVAYFFHKKAKLNVEWTKSGPDLKALSGRSEMYIECYTYRKSFPLLNFIGEIFDQIDSHLKVGHSMFLRVCLPQVEKADQFLDTFFTPFLNPEYLPSLYVKAEQTSPLVIPVSCPDIQNVYFYFENDNLLPGQRNNFDWSITGNADEYLEKSLQEAVNNKRHSNKIADYHPNLLAINYLLSPDYQIARLLSTVKNKRPSIDLGDEFDAVLATAEGIDGKITSGSTILEIKTDISHPIKEIGCLFSLLDLRSIQD